MPFAINEVTRFIRPTKTPEYLAGGKPVVSTPISDVMRHYGRLGGVTIAATPGGSWQVRGSAGAGGRRRRVAGRRLTASCRELGHHVRRMIRPDGRACRCQGQARHKAPPMRPPPTAGKYDYLIVGAASPARCWPSGWPASMAPACC